MAEQGTINSRSEVTTQGTIAATPGSTVTLTITGGRQLLYASWTSGESESVVIDGAQTAGSTLTLKITNDATLPRVITFGTGFKSIGVITGTVSKAAMITFVSDGTNFYELSRTLVL